MNKKTIAEEIDLIINGGDPGTDSSVDFREILEKLGQNGNKALQEFCLDANRNTAVFNLPNEIVQGFTVSLTDNKATLSVRPISLIFGHRYTTANNNNLGIYEVRQVGDCKGDPSIVPMQGTKGLTSSLEASSMDNGKLGYYLTGRRFELHGVDEDANIESVEIDMVPNMIDLEEDHELYLPGTVIQNIKFLTLKELAPHLEIKHDNKYDNSDRNDISRDRPNS